MFIIVTHFKSSSSFSCSVLANSSSITADSEHGDMVVMGWGEPQGLLCIGDSCGASVFKDESIELTERERESERERVSV